MKEFMMIFIGADYGALGLSPEEMQVRMGKWFTWSEKMESDGITIKHGNALTEPIRRVSGKNRTVTDLNSAELKEVVGGYYIIEARDFDHVEEIAQGFPDYDLGNTVEIREIMVFDQ